MSSAPGWLHIALDTVILICTVAIFVTNLRIARINRRTRQMILDVQRDIARAQADLDRARLTLNVSPEAARLLDELARGDSVLHVSLDELAPKRDDSDLN